MKKLFIIIIVLLLFTVMVSAKLSNETLKEVEKLRSKHYGAGMYFKSDTANWDSVFEWWSMTFKDGKLFVETQDGKWFIEMKEIKEGGN